MKKIGLDIVALSHSVTQSHNYAIVLGERHGKRRLPIIIGGFEAQAIAVALERMIPNRPLTHDLMKNTMDTFNIDLKEVIISNLLDGVFYARLLCQNNLTAETFEVDSRTSDALAMAVRFNCPIYTFEFILEAAGVVLEEADDESGEENTATTSNQKSTKKDSSSLTRFSTDELKRMLNEVLGNEDYEQAATIRDEIQKRGSNS